VPYVHVFHTSPWCGAYIQERVELIWHLSPLFCYRWQLNERVVQEVAVSLQVKVMLVMKNKKRRKKKRTERLVCSVQMCGCVDVELL